MHVHRYGERECPSCGRRIELDRHGRYRRHYAFELDGHRHLCDACGCQAVGVVELLAVEPTPEERRSHVLGLFDRRAT